MPFIVKEDLDKYYTQQELSIHDTAKILNVSVGSVYNYLVKYNIPRRKEMPEKSRKRLSEKMKGRPSSLKGIKLSDETKKKISEGKRGKYINKTQFGGHVKNRTDGYIYIYCPTHPKATKDGYVMEHILVMENHINRYLNTDEVVHHKNKNRSDNRIENLQLMKSKEHASFHMKERWQKRKEKKDAQ